MRWLVGGPAIVWCLTISVASSAQDKFLESKGIRIRYVDQGSGEPVVLVHGYTSSIERGWMDTGVFANLTKDHRVIAFDVRGHGKSAGPHDPKAYGNEMSQDIVRLLDHLGIRRAHIVGYSMGGRIVTKLLTTNPERFLTATLGGFGEVNWTAADDQVAEAEAAETERGLFRALILSIAPTDEPVPTDEAIRQRSQQIIGYGNDPMALAALVRTRRDLAVTEAQLAAVRVPTEAIVGSADSRLAAVNHLKMVLPALKVVVVQGAVHSTTNERGAARRPEFCNTIREFIAAHHAQSSK